MTREVGTTSFQDVGLAARIATAQRLGGDCRLYLCRPGYSSRFCDSISLAHTRTWPIRRRRSKQFKNVRKNNNLTKDLYYHSTHENIIHHISVSFYHWKFHSTVSCSRVPSSATFILGLNSAGYMQKSQYSTVIF